MSQHFGTKKRILVVNEFSELMTGFATYMHYVLPYLHNSGKYEIAELAGYCNPLHPGIDKVPWKVYPNEPDPRNQQECEIFGRSKENQFGRYRFEEVCLDFQPDIIINISDPWMSNWIQKSPYRKHFHWLQMPTIDGAPQKQEWIDVYEMMDTVLSYSFWAKNLIEEQSGGRVEVKAVASPGVDPDVYRPRDKKELRDQFGLEDDIFLIQTVMRNQPRKLFPDLFKAFADFIDLCYERGHKEIADKTFLHCHTTNPDVGWDIPMELRNHGISHKVLFTYMCDNCQHVYPSFWNGDTCHCKICGQKTARLPNTAKGVDREALAHIMGCADLYVQHSISEGWGMPVNDAKGCGVPVFATDYSALSEQAYAPGAWPIEVERFCQESLHQTNQWRAFGSNSNLTDKLDYFFCKMTQEQRDNMGREGSEYVHENYSWQNIASIWESVIDEIDLTVNKAWNAEPVILEQIPQVPQNISNEQFVFWCYSEILKEPEAFNSVVGQKTLTLLNMGYEPGMSPDGKPIRHPVDREKIFNMMCETAKNKNQLEYHRYMKINNIAPPKQQVEVSTL